MEELIKIVEQYVEKGSRCMDKSENDQGAYTFWDGFHNCAENILRELKDFNLESRCTIYDEQLSDYD